MKTKKVNPAVSEFYRKLGKKSAEAREKKIIEESRKVVKSEITKNK